MTFTNPGSRGLKLYSEVNVPTHRMQARYDLLCKAALMAK